MGTTSEKLSYLNTTKEKIRDSINLTGANLTSEDTFRSYASKLKQGYIDIINNGIDTLYNNFPKVSGIGSNLSLAPTYEAPMKLNEIQGSTLQDGTPTPDTPVEIQSVTGLQNVNVCGKNLLKNQGINQTINGITFTKNEDGSITASGTATATAFYNMSEFTLPAGTYNISQGFQGTSGYYLQLVERVSGTPVIANISSRTNRTFTLLEQKNLRVNFRIANGTTIDNLITFPMIEQGSTATEYEPYKGNTYEVNLGKNLFDIESFVQNNSDYYTLSNNKLTCIQTDGRSSGFTYFQKFTAGTYTISTENNCNIRVFIEGSSIATINDVKELTFTIGTDANLHFKFFGNDLPLLIGNVQIEKGTQSTSFSPYFTPIELNKIGDYKDSIKKSNGKNIITTYNYASSGYINYNYDNSKIGKTMTYSFIPNFSTTNATLYIRANTSISSYNVGTISTITSGTKVSVTFTLTDEQYNTIKNTTGGYIQIYKSGVSMDENSISNPMLEENSQATDYEPYGKVWYVEKNIGKVVLDGSENWSENGENTDYGQYSLSISNKQYGNDLLSDKFIPHTGSTGNYIWGRSTNNNIYITIAKSIISYGLATFKTWLSTHNTTVYYVLATPTYTEITNTELIEDLETLYTAKSQDGTTNISITSEDLEMILNVSALKGDA